jgi:hypothetical protein
VVCLPSGFLICSAKPIGDLLHHALVLDAASSLLVDEIGSYGDRLAMRRGEAWLEGWSSTLIAIVFLLTNGGLSSWIVHIRG